LHCYLAPIMRSKLLCCVLPAWRLIRQLRWFPQGPRQTQTEEKMKQRERECIDKAIYPTPARKRNFTRIACYSLLAATVITVPGTVNAWDDNNGVFFKLNNPGDPNFISCSASMTTKSSLAISATAPLFSTMGTF
jgi:hypothetical protein